MKKKISLILGMCFIILGLTACGKADPTQRDYNGYTYDQLKEQCQNTVWALESMSEQEAEEYKMSENTILVSMITHWQEARTGVGEYQELGEFTITESGKTMTCELEVVYEECPIILSYVYKSYNMELEDVTVNRVETLGEKMENAVLNTLTGMGTVFLVLCLISLIIYGFKIFPYLESKKLAKEVHIEHIEIEQEETEVQDNLELVAVIAAAIAESTGTSTDDFVVRSIKRRV